MWDKFKPTTNVQENNILWEIKIYYCMSVFKDLSNDTDSCKYATVLEISMHTP